MFYRWWYFVVNVFQDGIYSLDRTHQYTYSHPNPNNICYWEHIQTQVKTLMQTDSFFFLSSSVNLSVLDHLLCRCVVDPVTVWGWNVSWSSAVPTHSRKIRSRMRVVHSHLCQATTRAWAIRYSMRFASSWCTVVCLLNDVFRNVHAHELMMYADGWSVSRCSAVPTRDRKIRSWMWVVHGHLCQATTRAWAILTQCGQSAGDA